MLSVELQEIGTTPLSRLRRSTSPYTGGGFLYGPLWKSHSDFGGISRNYFIKKAICGELRSNSGDCFIKKAPLCKGGMSTKLTGGLLQSLRHGCAATPPFTQGRHKGMISTMAHSALLF